MQRATPAAQLGYGGENNSALFLLGLLFTCH